MAFSHVTYIDEAGDEGFGKIRRADGGGQSQWLLLGATIVRGEDDKYLPRWRDDILARFPQKKSKDLHFRNLKHEQKVVVCQEISAHPIKSCITFSNKATIPGSQWADTFKRPGYLYNFLTRWLLERVTTYCADDAAAEGIAHPRLKVVFSRRSNTDYQHMYDYMMLMRDGREQIRRVRSINWQVFNPSDIVVEPHERWAGLQMADAATSAFFNAVEANGYGNYEPQYANILKPTVIVGRTTNRALGTGVTPVPSLNKSEPNAHQRRFFEAF